MTDGNSTFSWKREGDRPWYWRSTLSFLTHLPDRTETLSSVFHRYEHSSLGAERLALDHVSWLVDSGEIPADATVAGAIAAMKRLRRAGATGDRGWQPP